MDFGIITNINEKAVYVKLMRFLDIAYKSENGQIKILLKIK